MDLVMNNKESAFGENLKNSKFIFQILLFYGSYLSNKTIDEKIHKVINMISQNDTLK